MITSENLTELAGALSKAQSKITNALKDTDNAFFKSRYADLASVWDACRKPLTENGLSVVQTLSSTVEGRVACTTMLLHISGQFIRSEFAMTPKDSSPQACGSCATYLRRYSLQAMVGIAPDDDDGNAASGKSQPRPTQAVATGGQVNERPNTTNAQVPTAKTVVDVSPVAKTSDTADNKPTPSAAPFDRNNASQIRYLQEWLIKRKQPGLIKEMVQQMEGKEFRHYTIEQAFMRIDPESPGDDPTAKEGV